MKDDVFISGLVVMLTVYLGLFLLAVIAPRLRKRDETSALNATDLLLAGRGIPLWMAIFTMTATWVGGGYLAGTAEMVYAEGQGWAQAGWGYALSLMFGGIFYAKKMRNMNYTTMLDPLMQRFGLPTTSFLYLFALLGEILWTAAIMTALGAAFATILGINMATGIIITASITLAYTAISGLWAVAYTDVIQLVMVFAFLTLGIVVAMPNVGGWQAMWDTYNADFGTLGAGFVTGYFPPLNAFRDPNWGAWTFTWIDYGLLYICGGIPWHCYFQRVLASRNGTVARWMSVGAGVGAFILVIPPSLIGVIGYNFDWAAAGAPEPHTAAMILPHVLRYAMPPLIGALGLGAVAAAVMSSVDSSVLSASAMFTWNVARPLKRKPMTDTQLKRTLRSSIIVIGVAATLLALRVESVYALWTLNCDLIYVTLFPALTLTLFYKYTNTIGVLAGVAVALPLRLAGGVPELGINPLFRYWIYDVAADTGFITVQFPFRTTAMIAGLFTMLIVSYLTRNVNPPRPLEKIALDVAPETTR